MNLFIIGTDTDVGKTFITCAMLRQLRATGIAAVGMKPVASGTVEYDGRQINEDIELVMQASGGEPPRGLINQYLFEPFIAPHLAAAEVGQSIYIDVVDAAYHQLVESSELVIVEGAGGLMTPLNETQTFVELIQQLQLGVVLVVAIRLGCINHALLTQQVLKSAKIPFVGWVANYPVAEQPPQVTIENSLKKRLNAPMLGIMPWHSSSGECSKLDLNQLF